MNHLIHIKLQSDMASISRWIAKGAYICNRGIRRQWLHPIMTYVGDKSGTELDGLVLAPVHGIRGVFHDHGIKLTVKQVRKPMGGPKIIHTKKLRDLPEVHQQLKALAEIKKAKGEIYVPPTALQIYDKIVPKQLEILKDPKYGQALPGVHAAMSKFKDWGIACTATTGYTRAMVDLVLKDQARQGYVPDHTVASDEVGRGRPWPFGVWRCMLKAGHGNVLTTLKADDTKEGALEGLGAGAPTVMTIKHGNLMGNYFDSMEDLERTERDYPLKFKWIMGLVRTEAESYGPDFIIDTAESLPDVVTYINKQAQSNYSFTGSYPDKYPFIHILSYINRCTKVFSNLDPNQWPEVEPILYLEQAGTIDNPVTTSDNIYSALEFIKMVNEEYELSLKNKLPNLPFLQQIKDYLIEVEADKFEARARAHRLK